MKVIQIKWIVSVIDRNREEKGGGDDEERQEMECLDDVLQRADGGFKRRREREHDRSGKRIQRAEWRSTHIAPLAPLSRVQSITVLVHIFISLFLCVSSCSISYHCTAFLAYCVPLINIRFALFVDRHRCSRCLMYNTEAAKKILSYRERHDMSIINDDSKQIDAKWRNRSTEQNDLKKQRRYRPPLQGRVRACAGETENTKRD